MFIKHCVWVTEAPSVCTILWSQADWCKYEDSYKPKDYQGGRYDQNAWDAYIFRKMLEHKEQYSNKNK